MMSALQGLVHITGGGFTENIPRIMPKGLGCSIDKTSWEVPQLFEWLQKVQFTGSMIQISRLIKSYVAQTWLDSF